MERILSRSLSHSIAYICLGKRKSVLLRCPSSNNLLWYWHAPLRNAGVWSGGCGSVHEENASPVTFHVWSVIEAAALSSFPLSSHLFAGMSVIIINSLQRHQVRLLSEFAPGLISSDKQPHMPRRSFHFSWEMTVEAGWPACSCPAVWRRRG